MDSFITWEGIIATAALAISLYNLRQAKRAPARARQRELRDQLRLMLEDFAAQVKTLSNGLRAGSVDLPNGIELHASTQKLTELARRLTNNHDGRIAMVVAELGTVSTQLSVLASARVLHAGRGHDAPPTAISVEMAIKDLDDACKAAAAVIAKEIQELNRLESA